MNNQSLLIRRFAFILFLCYDFACLIYTNDLKTDYACYTDCVCFQNYLSFNAQNHKNERHFQLKYLSFALNISIHRAIICSVYTYIISVVR